jgi:hypothetical protein
VVAMAEVEELAQFAVKAKFGDLAAHELAQL